MRLLFFFCLTVTLISACREDGKDRTSAGYHYVNHTHRKGPKAKDGDIVYYHVQHRNGDKVLFSSRAGERPPLVYLLPDFATLTSRPSPIVDVLREMTVGDSATVIFPLDSMTLRPKGYADAKAIEYDVVLEKIEKGDPARLAEIEKQRETDEPESATIKGTLPATESDTGSNQSRVVIDESSDETVSKSILPYIQDYKSGKLENRIVTTNSGLKMLILFPGDGPKAKPLSFVSVHYYGLLPNGKKFDSSFDRGKPLQFELGKRNVIVGWDEGIGYLNKGGKAILFVPAHLGYGKQGNKNGGIPSDSELYFYVHLTNVEKL